MRALLGGVAIGAILAGAGVYYFGPGFGSVPNASEQADSGTGSSASGAGGAETGDVTVADAEAFLAETEAEMREFGEFASRTAWVQNNFITYDTNWLLERMSTQATEMSVAAAGETARYADLDLPETMARKMNFLR